MEFSIDRCQFIPTCTRFFCHMGTYKQLERGKSLQSLIQSLFIVSHSYQSNLSNFWWICSFSGWICSFSGLKSSFLGWISSFLLLDYFYSINYRYISCLPCMLMREAHTLIMCRHNNEGNPLTEHVQSLYWACADILTRDIH